MAGGRTATSILKSIGAAVHEALSAFESKELVRASHLLLLCYCLIHMRRKSIIYEEIRYINNLEDISLGRNSTR